MVGVAGVGVKPFMLPRGKVGASGGHQGAEDLNLWYVDARREEKSQ